MLNTSSLSALTIGVTALSLFSAAPARADVPHVAADIAPVHALVAQVMQGVGTPDLILPPGASPHGYAMRPSEAAALSQADLVVWVGEALVPWLEKPLSTIASDATRLELLEQPGTTLLELRETPVFTAAADGDNHDDHDDHDHAEAAQDEKHDDHDHAKEDHDDHSDDHADHDDHHDHDHAPGSIDPHAWLAPENAVLWLGQIATTLSELDPENATTYQANAEQAKAELQSLSAELTATLEPVKSTPFVVFHDAYQYFETTFGLSAAGAISLSDASRPSPARIATLQDEVRQAGIRCALAEPQFNPGLIATVFEGTGVEVQVIDPLGSSLQPGPALYAELMRNMAASLSACAK